MTDTISILQINEGDCQHIFEKGNQYVVFGLAVKGIECKNSQSKKEYEQAPPPPTADELDNGTIVRVECTNEHRIDYWNNLIAQRPSFLTNTCVTYLGNSKPGQLILNN